MPLFFIFSLLTFPFVYRWIWVDITKGAPQHLDLFFSVPGSDCLVYGVDGQTQTGQAAETWPHLWGWVFINTQKCIYRSFCLWVVICYFDVKYQNFIVLYPGFLNHVTHTVKPFTTERWAFIPDCKRYMLFIVSTCENYRIFGSNL